YPQNITIIIEREVTLLARERGSVKYVGQQRLRRSILIKNRIQMSSGNITAFVYSDAASCAIDVGDCGNSSVGIKKSCITAGTARRIVSADDRAIIIYPKGHAVIIE